MSTSAWLIVTIRDGLLLGASIESSPPWEDSRGYGVLRAAAFQQTGKDFTEARERLLEMLPGSPWESLARYLSEDNREPVSAEGLPHLGTCASCGGDWIPLSCTRGGSQVTMLTAAHDCDDVPVLAEWVHRSDGKWDVWAVNLAGAEEVVEYDPDNGDVVPMEPPFARGGS